MKRRHPHRWVAVSTTSVSDPRVSPHDEHARRLVLVTLLIDDRGRLWERIGKDDPELLGGPPEGPNDDGAESSTKK